MATEALLIDRADIEKYYPFGKNIKDEKLDTFILRAQQSDLKSFIGEEMYWVLFEDAAETEIVELMDGVEYEWNGHTIFYSGLKQLIATYAYRRLLLKDSTFVTRGGVARKDTIESTPETDPQITQGGRDARSESGRLEDEANQYLDEERTKYPAWNQSFRKNQ